MPRFMELDLDTIYGKMDLDTNLGKLMDLDYILFVTDFLNLDAVCGKYYGVRYYLWTIL